ncbi:MAG: hypothetical protein HY709_02855, partial [Candidatus Latescibacteria bacterium]|nr:hypothetical protein [Candidatus Latescibacterota bacterium]
MTSYVQELTIIDTAEAYNRLLQRLQAVGQVERRVVLMTGIVTAVTALIGLGGLWVLVESLFYLPPGVKMVAAAACLAPSVIRVIWGGIPFIKRRGTEKVAMIVEKGLPQLNGRLIGSLQLWSMRNGSPEGYSPA